MGDSGVGFKCLSEKRDAAPIRQRGRLRLKPCHDDAVRLSTGHVALDPNLTHRTKRRSMADSDPNPFAAPAGGTLLDVSESVARTAWAIRLRLFLMMFLQYFIQGSYLPVVSVYVQDALGFTAREVGYFGAALAVGPLFASFLVGQLVDRHYATQYVLAASHLAGGALMLLLYTQDAFWPVVILGTLYSVLYFPSLMLTNSLAFAHLKDRDREFPLVRLWGTIGFVLPAWAVEIYWLAGLTGDQLDHARGVVFLFAGIAGLVMAVYSLTLPHTPPTRQAESFAPGVVIGMLRRRDFAVLVGISFVVALVHKFYFVWNSPFIKYILAGRGAYEQRISSIGQIFEVLVMAGLGLMIKRIGFKWTFVAGATAYAARCLMFTIATSFADQFSIAITLTCLGQALHGFCFACSLAAAFIFVDRRSPPDVRGSMQNFYGTFVLGLGLFVGGIVSGNVGQYFTSEAAGEKVRNWQGIWLSCGALAVACVVGLIVLFPRETEKQEPAADPS